MPDRLTFQFLDVGMGDSTLVQIRADGAGHDRLVLVDCGERRTPSQVPYRDALEYLVATIDANSAARGRADPYVDHLILTHPDGDHYNKIPDLVGAAFPNYPRRRLRFGDLNYSGEIDEYGDVVRRTLAPLIDAARGIDEMLDNYYSRLDAVGDLTPWKRFGNVNAYILSSNWPDKQSADLNAKSIVLMFELDGKRVILTGDATRATERHILRDVVGDAPGEIDCYALKLGHHGSNGSTGRRWVQTTTPTAIFASGDQVWAHPYCRAICMVLDYGALNDFPRSIYYCCGDADDYSNNETRRRIGMNLWYVVKSRRERLTDEETGHTVWGYRDNAYGVQWQLRLTTGRAIEILRTDSYLPQEDVDDPFDCHPAVAGDPRLDDVRALAATLPALDPIPA
ncbi:ComEC/Rec2 family competence protein [Conexibacter woesei]|uniref:Beta-lactamase domain protein n=1 Tax=Conexibacter woesei (strain DSM 14684 / CCUG 47730 / CIP 108061 / JCM 11494 / NBRC 100937 / ID131577) TaxID=469383 RepID=D3FD77_CONWI|nr:MBL fold metallo-hydrolase [Conexibacter woesei]ADB53469.1 beta-lactamase domain protein [Conexibacter woesei DSM 14684]